MTQHRYKLLVALAMAAFVVPLGDTPVSADTCSGTTFANDNEKLWVQRVTAFTTNLSCHEARWVFRNVPSWRDEMPGRVTATGGVLVSPALAGSAAAEAGASITCTVWTTEKYRTPVIPLGDHVLWSVKMTQSFGYNNSTVVWVDNPIIHVDTTEWGFRWSVGGAPWGQSWWDPPTQRIKHWTDRNQPMQSWAIHPTIGSTASVAYLWNWKQWNGDWATTNDNGLAGCRDDD